MVTEGLHKVLPNWEDQALPKEDDPLSLLYP